MFNIGDKIVYGTNGVFEIDDIRDELVLGEKHTYFVLRSIAKSSESLSFVPTDNERLVSLMRYPLTKAEAEALIRSIGNIEPAEWLKESRRRMDRYRELLESGDHASIVSVIKSVWQNSENRLKEGKRGYVSDENVLKKAEAILYSELALALDMDEASVAEYISSVCEAQK